MTEDDKTGTVAEKVRTIVRSHVPMIANVDIRDKDDLFRIGMTSHATVAVMLALEDAFEVEFPDAMLSRSTFRSVASMRDAVLQLVSDHCG